MLEDPTVSSRHLRLAPLEGGEWVAVDLGSTHGTKLGKRQIHRAVLAWGDQLTLGRTGVTLLERAPDLPKAPPPGPLVGGTLDLRPAGPGPTAAAPSAPAPVVLVGGTLDLRPVGGTSARAPLPAPGSASAPSAPDARPAPPPPAAPPSPSREPSSAPPAAASPAATPAADAGPGERPVRPIDGKSMGRALVLVVLGVLVLIVSEGVLRPQANRARARARERQDLRSALEKMDISPETFEGEVQDFLSAHPDAPEEAALVEYLAAVRAREAVRVRAESELNSLAVGRTDLPESEVRERLLELQRTLPWDEDIVSRARLHLQVLNRRQDEAGAASLDAVVRAAEARLAEKDPAGALRRLSAFRTAWPSLAPEALTRLQAAENAAIAAADRLVETALAEADGQDDPRDRRRLLGAAWRGLAGLPQAERVADALRFTRTPGGASAGAPSSAPGATPPAAPGTEEPGVETGVLAKAAAAEDLTRQRRWSEAMGTLIDLLETAPPGLLRDEWQARARELRWVLGLVDALRAAAVAGDAPSPHLSLGKAKVKAADGEGVELEIGTESRRIAWPDVPAEDLLPLLSPSRPTPEQRLGLAVLAAGASRQGGLRARWSSRWSRRPTRRPCGWSRATSSGGPRPRPRATGSTRGRSWTSRATSAGCGRSGSPRSGSGPRSSWPRCPRTRRSRSWRS